MWSQKNLTPKKKIAAKSVNTTITISKNEVEKREASKKNVSPGKAISTILDENMS